MKKNVCIAIVGFFTYCHAHSYPKIVIGIVIDQFSYSYFAKYPDSFGEKGFNLFFKKGAVFNNAIYDYPNTYTAPGHATIYTGTLPSIHGIVGNTWYNRSTEKEEYCVEDALMKGIDIEGEEGRRSPKNLLVMTVSDYLRKKSPDSKVLSISLKDRSAILPAGKNPTLCLWLDKKNGNWMTSSYYGKSLPQWVENINRGNPVKQYIGYTWMKSLKQYAGSDNVIGEGYIDGESKSVFPHGLKTVYAILSSPVGDEILEKMSEDAILNERLGQDDVTDFLELSFSSLDLVGHIFGPDSQEVEDMLFRLDKTLQVFFEFVDKKIGLQNAVIFLTSDHGVAPLPEISNTPRNPERLFVGQVTSALRRFDMYDNSVVFFQNDEFYLHPKTNSKQLSVITNALHEDPTVLRVVNYTNKNADKSTMNGYYKKRSGDLKVLFKPMVFLANSFFGTTHGSQHEYDTKVPVLFMGERIQQGVFNRKISPADIAPTIHYLLNLPKTNQYQGRILNEMVIK